MLPNTLALSLRILPALLAALLVEVGTAPAHAAPQAELAPARGTSLVPSATDTTRGVPGNLEDFMLRNGSDWTRWWAFNREPFLSALRTPGAGPVGPMPLRGQRPAGAVQGLDLGRVHGDVVPLLRERLDKTRSLDVAVGCLLALGKIGEAPRALAQAEDLDPMGVEKAIRSRLTDDNARVRNAAIMALGLVGGPRAAASLGGIAAETPGGKKVLGGGAIDTDSRAYGVYALGLIGHHTRRLSERTAIVARLLELAETEAKDSSISPAAIIGLGWAPLPLVAPGSDEQGTAGQAGTVRRLLALFDGRRTNSVARAHAPVALARLVTAEVAPVEAPSAAQLAVLRAELRAEVLERFIAGLAPRGGDKSPVVREGMAQALGLMVEPRPSGWDRKAMDALVLLAKGRQAREGGLAQIALARIAARAGEDDDRQRVAGELLEVLLELNAKGSDSQRSWASMALGLHEHRAMAAGSAPSLRVRAALHRQLRDGDNPGGAAAAAVALGLAGDHEVHGDLVDALESGPFFARGLYSGALALMGAREALVPLRQVIARDELVPAYLREAALALALFRDEGLVELLGAKLSQAGSTDERLSALRGLSLCNDPGALPSLIHVLKEKRIGSAKIDDRARAFAASALGVLSARGSLL